MKLEEKFKILHNFSETQLVNSIIVSLFKSMGFKDISITHGINEHGLDLIFYKETEFGEREYTGVQVKAVKIHGTAGKTGNATEILVQANQAFSHSFHDIYDNSTRKIDRFIVITSHDIDNTARDSIKDQLLSMKVHKTIHFFDGTKLIDLIDKHMKSFFWNEYDYFHRYFNAMKKDFETIKDISAIGQKDPIPLEQMYVSLKVSEKTREHEIPLENG